MLPAGATPTPGHPPLARDTAARSRPIAAAYKPPQTMAAARPAALPAAAPAPQWVTLRGVVVRPTGRPCAGASVYLALAPRQLGVTDAQGAFTLPVPAGAAVLLRVEYFGEGSSRVEVRLPAPDALRITLGQ